MKKVFLSALIASAVIMPCIVHAQWQVGYVTSDPWYKKFPAFVSGAWVESGSSGTITGNVNGGTIQRGSANYPVNQNLYQECKISGNTTVTLTWTGNQYDIPHFVDLRVTIIRSGWFTEAYDGTAWFNSNLINQSIWTNADGTQSGTAFTSTTTDYIIDCWQTNPPKDYIAMNFTVPDLIAHAKLLYENPPDPSGGLGINVGVSCTITGQAIPWP